MTICSKLTVFFDDPFWVGVYERHDNGKLEVSRIVFGAEPKDYEVYDFILKNWGRLIFSKAIDDTKTAEKKTNPKRTQRDIHKQLTSSGIGTKAQEAIKLQYSENKQERCKLTKLQEQKNKERLFILKQQKKKQKHKGK